MNGIVQMAVVATVTPLAVRLKGATTNTPVQQRTQALPGDIAIGQRALVVVVEGQLTWLGRWDAV